MLTTRSASPRWAVGAALIALAAILLTLFPASPPAAQAVAFTTSQIAGADRFATAAAVATRVQPGTGGTVIIASGANYPDALAAGPVATSLGAPILLTHESQVPQPTRDAISRQKPTRVIIVGSTSVVPASVATTIESLAPGANVERYGGANRHETAALLATTFFPTATEAFVATGWNFPDALSAGAIAALRKAPILLGTSGGLTEPTWNALETLAPAKYWLVGGTNVLTPGTPPAALGSTAVERLSGADRFGTNAAVVNRFVTNPTYAIHVASASNFPDALVAAPLAARNNAPLVLSLSSCTGQEASTLAERLLGLRPYNASHAGSRSITRVGGGIAEQSVLTVCGGTTIPPWSIIRPSGLAATDVTPNQLRSFIDEVNAIRRANGLAALSNDRFLVGTGAFSTKVANHGAELDRNGYTLNPHAGAVLGNEVVFMGYSRPGGLVYTGADVARSWWDTLPFRDVLYQPGGTKPYGGPNNASTCIVVNINQSPGGYMTASAGWTSCVENQAQFNVKPANVINATQVDLALAP